MALLSQIYRYSILVPFIVLTALPALLIAIITTSLAFLTLSLRTFALGVDLASRFMPYYLLKPRPKPTASRPQLLPSKLSFSSKTNRRKQATSPLPQCSTPSSSLSLNLGLDSTRDYEGVGGWQLSHDPEEKDIVWEPYNPRSQLSGIHGRRRIMSLSSGVGSEFW